MCLCHSGYRVADLRLIFCAASGLDEAISTEHYAYVFWYGSISAPTCPSRLRTVKKMMQGTSRAGGVVPLADLHGRCPLAPVLSKTCPQGIDEFNVYDKIDSFYINPFSSHTDFEQFC
jgi:hypothetical protein